MVGIPCSGKTTRAKQLAKFLAGSGKFADENIHLINEESLGLDKFQYLQNANQEKIFRATLKSNVDKNLTGPESVVILDSMNYIKGYRYELYCIARNVMTTLCIIWCDTNKDKAKEWCVEINPQVDGQAGEDTAAVENNE